MKKITFIIAFLVASISATVAQDINTVFPSIPSSVLFGLEVEQKEMLLMNIHDSIPTSTKNVLASEVTRLAITDNYLALQTSPVGDIQIKLLSLVNDTKVICVVKTVCSKICDSQINFYTDKWKLLPNDGLLPPFSIDWFLKDGIDRDDQDFKNAYAILDMHPMKIRLSANKDDLTVSLDIKNHLDKKEYEKLEPYLAENKKVLVWGSSSYE